MEARDKLKNVSVHLGRENALAAELGPRTVLGSKNALIRQTLQEHLVGTVNKYLRPDESKISSKTIENIIQEKDDEYGN